MRKLPPPLPTDLRKFLSAPKGDLVLGVGRQPSCFHAPGESGRESIASAPVRAAVQSLIVEGWRFTAHSYAIINQRQLLAVARRADVHLRVIGVPRGWQTQEGLLDPEAEKVLKSIQSATLNDSADVTLRVAFPFAFSIGFPPDYCLRDLREPSVRRYQLPDWRAREQLRLGPPAMDVKALTPSRWSAEGFYKAGFKAEQVLIVSQRHGSPLQIQGSPDPNFAKDTLA